MSDKRYGYMCAIDFDHELGEVKGSTKVYASVKDLLHNHPCAMACGIVRVEVVVVDIVKERKEWK